MRSNLLLSAVVASAAVFPALAQQSTEPSTSPPPSAQTTSSTPMPASGQWRASKLIGLNVYNDQNEKLGDINEILLDQSGKPTGYVIGVGGFLGLGQHEILVTTDKLKFVNEPVRTTTTTTSTTAPPPTTTAPDRAAGTSTTAMRPARAANEKWYPDHAIMSGATKDSLKSMPEFKYN